MEIHLDESRFFGKLIQTWYLVPGTWFPKQENYYQFLFPIGKIGKANGHPDEKVPSHYLGNEFGDSPSQFSHQHGERTEVLSMDRQVTLLQHPPLASWPFPHCINPLFGHDRHVTSSRPSSLAGLHSSNNYQLSPDGPPPLHRYHTSKVKTETVWTLGYLYTTLLREAILLTNILKYLKVWPGRTPSPLFSKAV